MCFTFLTAWLILANKGHARKLFKELVDRVQLLQNIIDTKSRAISRRRRIYSLAASSKLLKEVLGVYISWLNLLVDVWLKAKELEWSKARIEHNDWMQMTIKVNESRK